MTSGMSSVTEDLAEFKQPDIDPLRFRQVLGSYPTGVTIVTALDSAGGPVGMVIGSFTSVSLDPPLVAFLPTVTSNTYARIRQSKTFCVNILGADQEGLSRRLGAVKDGIFSEVEWRKSPSGAPIFAGSLAWIECETDQVIEAGDHVIVLGRVLDLDSGAAGAPLVFFRGGFGRFSPQSVVVPMVADLAAPLRVVDVARPVMERLATELAAEVGASAAVGHQMVTLASAGPSTPGRPTWVGTRSPLIPPMGLIYYAWSSPEVFDEWLETRGVTESGGDVMRIGAKRIRERGWSISMVTDRTEQLEDLFHQLAAEGLTPSLEAKVRQALPSAGQDYNPELNPELQYEVQFMNVPVFDAEGTVVLTLTTYGRSDGSMSPQEIEVTGSRMLKAAESITNAIGGRVPASYKQPGV